jgi:hypothetical protein
VVVYFDVFATQIVDVLSPRRVFELSRGVEPLAPSVAARPIVAIWGGLPVLIGIVAWQRNRALRPVIAALVAAPALWVALWLLSARAGAALVHLDLAFGTVLLYPVLGLALAQLARERAGLAALGIAAVGLALLSVQQTRAFDRAWPDSTGPVAALVGAVQPGERVLSNQRWPYALALYAAGRIDEPDDVLDETLLFERDTVFDFCSFSWFVDTQPVEPWSPLVTAGIGSCGTFEPISISSSQVSTLTGELREQEQTVQTTVRRNTQPFQEEL